MANEVRTNEEDIKQKYKPNIENRTIDFDTLVKNLDIGNIDKKTIDPDQFPLACNKGTKR